MKITILFIIFSIGIMPSTIGQNYKKEWLKVEALELKGEVEDANILVNKIFIKAKKRGQSKDIIKSFIYKTKFNNTLVQDNHALFIAEIRKEILEAQFPTNAILETIYANYLWAYLKSNRYKLQKRTGITAKDENLFLWSIDQVQKEIELHFNHALQSKHLLQHIELEEYLSILEGNANTLKYRPTLYDFIVHSAISYYQNLRFDAYFSETSDDYSDFYLPSRTFIQLNLNSVSDYSTQKVLELYQHLETFHLQEQSYDALFDAYIHRLKFLNYRKAHNRVLEKKDYLAFFETLETTIAAYANNKASSQLSFALADFYIHNRATIAHKNENGVATNRIKAHTLCKEVIAKFPNADGAINCRRILNNLETKFLRFETATITAASKPSLARVSYSNIDSVLVSIFKVPADLFKKHNAGLVSNMNTAERDSITMALFTQKKPLLEKRYALIDPMDYHQHSAEILIPKLATGHYLILASKTKAPLSKEDYSYQTAYKSNLSMDYTKTNTEHEFHVTDRETGAAIRNAQIEIFSKDYRYHIRKITDQNGMATEKLTQKSQLHLQGWIIKDEDSLKIENFDLNNYKYSSDQSWNVYSKLLLDRNIYRPGQTLHFKGYLYQTKNGERSVVPNEYCTILISDVNGNDLKEFRLKTNDFGSINGSYTLPKNILTGEFSIEMDEDFDYEEEQHPFWDEIEDFEYNEVSFHVEDYKRPRFEVRFEPVTENYKLPDSVFIKGKASSFFDTNVAKAKVNYTVSRQEGGKNKSIAQGITITDFEGDFVIPFQSHSKTAKERVKYRYTVTADVTDTNGETRSATKELEIGSYLMDFQMKFPYHLDSASKDPLLLISKNLNAGVVASEGEVSIYKIADAPETIFSIKRLTSEYQTVEKDTFKLYFPYLKYNYSKEDPNSRGELIYSSPFSTKDSVSIAINSKIKKTGRYVIKVSAFEAQQHRIQLERRFSYKNLKDDRANPNKLFGYNLQNNNYAEDEFIKLDLNSSFENVYITVRAFYQEKEIFRGHFNTLNDTLATIPITGIKSGKINISLSGTKYNVFYANEFNVLLSPREDQFEIETRSYRNKLIPDQQETWQFNIKSLDENVEVLASMYDASLDDFFKNEQHYYNPKHLDWDPDFEYDHYFSFPGTDAVDDLRSFASSNFMFTNYKSATKSYLNLNYFGWSFTNSKYSNNTYLQNLMKKSKTRLALLGNVSGIVTDENGIPLPGATVLISGTKRGVSTDFDGFYSLMVNPGETLEFRYVGYSTDQVTYTNSPFINMAMELDNSLDEVVVTAFGIAREFYAGNRVSYTSVNDFTKDLSRKLSGASKGLEVNNASSQTQIILRGYNAINSNNQALIVVDGVIVGDDAFTSLSPQSIASSTFLRGAHATALYGSNAANGVIVITTKFGTTTVETSEGKKIVAITAEEITTIETRKNLKETAFFYPNLLTNKDGLIEVRFNGPQALTQWKFQLLAHSKNLKYGYLKLDALTKKELVVVPNLPRFLREGDLITLSTKVSNLSSAPMTGKAYLQLFDADTNKEFAAQSFKSFQLESHASKNISWSVTIPKEVERVRYKIIASANGFSDGEEGMLNVLKKKILVTETLPLFVKGASKKVAEFKKLAQTESATLEHKNLTVTYTSNPIWLAFQSLPYLMDYPYDCAEQLFSKYYANALGQHLLETNLDINTYVNSLNTKRTNETNSTSSSEPTPFAEALDSDDQKNIALLFDKEQLNTQEQNLIIRLKALQLTSGGFSWFSNQGNPNLFITQHIVATYGHLLKLGVTAQNESALDNIVEKAIQFLDNYYGSHSKAIDKMDSKLLIHYLYSRSFFMEKHELQPKNTNIIDKTLTLLANDWVTKNLYQKAMIALVMQRFNKNTVAQQILKSLEQSSITDETFGTYWKENTPSAYWDQAPIETQALLIEAFAEIENNPNRIDDMKLWLLNNKQTNNWKTTKATTEAIYALMQHGNSWVATDKKSTITIGNQVENSETVSNGYYVKSYAKNEINSSKAQIEIYNKSKGPGFGGVYWQYFEDLDKISSAETPLSLKKRLFKKINTDTGEEISELTSETQLKVGDLVRVRIELRSDRAMEFIHMKDMRAAGLEPINVLSQYKYQDGLGYYESTRDASTNFFFDYLPKGVYVFEYDLRVNNAGNMSNGITTIQSMYAPEFSSHSEGIRIEVGM